MPVNARTEFHPLTVDEIRPETADALSIRFAVPPELADRFRFAPGQYLTLRAEIDGEDVRRTYSICAAPQEGELRVAVKRLPGGRFSGFVGSLKAGDRIEVLAPAGHFTHDFPNEDGRHYAAFAAGSGITPVLSLIGAALAADPACRFTLCYGNRQAGDILFLEALAALKDRHMGRLEIFHFLSAEESEIALFNGRLDRAKCDDILATLIDPAALDRVFLCGPEGMMDAAEGALLAAGVAPERILAERFTTGAFQPVHDDAAMARARAAEGRRMKVVLDGRRVTLAFDAGAGNILDSVRAGGLPAPYACKGGVCATCRARVVEGEVEMRVNYGLSAEEVAAGYVLTCQSVPVGDGVVIDYDA